MLGLWSIVEKVTGVNRQLIKDSIRTAAVEYVQEHTCKCGCMKWVHVGMMGQCSHCKERCPRFAAKS